MYRYTTPRFLHKLDPWLHWSMPRKDLPCVYLSFDDGPHPEITPWVLDQLQSHKALATFFCVGDNVKKHPRIYRQILDAGHRTGNHTFNHLNGWSTPANQYLRNIDLCREWVDSDLFRPPYGKIGPWQALQLRKQQYRVVMWSLLSRDFEKNLDREDCLQNLKTHTRDGAIVLFHDSIKAQANLEKILPEYLGFCRDQGYQFATL